nr:unnamed protein product [Callosobruchus analis]
MSDDDLDILPSKSEYVPSDEDIAELIYKQPNKRTSEIWNLTTFAFIRTDDKIPIMDRWYIELAYPLPVPGIKPTDYFFRLFDLTLQRLIVQETNAYAVDVLFGSSSEHDVENKRKDALQKIRLVILLFNNKMLTVYYPNKELSLDESMMLWRGRLAFRQYIKINGIYMA